jgi:zinc transport system substrate-binding protein
MDWGTMIKSPLHSMGKIAVPLLVLLFSSATLGHAADKLPVFVSVNPQKYFVDRIGNGLVAVQVMVQPGANPAIYEPKPRQMADLAKAKVYFAIGVPFEDVWLPRIAAANPGMRVVHTEKGIVRQPMAAHHHRHDEHDAEDAQHGGLDPHIWLSPPLVKIQVKNILSALIALDPAHQEVYEANYRRFASDIDGLDRRLKNIFAGHQGLRFIVFHPAWGYFARTYGIEQVPIEIEGKAPKPSQLQALIEQARKAGMKVIFVQPQFSTKSAEIIAREIGGRVAFADPLAEDWMANLVAVGKEFKAALK